MPLRKWLLETQVAPADETIDFLETPRGRLIRVVTAAPEVRPLTVIPAGPARVRVILGGFMWGGVFWYADSRASPTGMDPQENGSVEHPNYYVDGLIDGDSIYVKKTIGFDGTFWKPSAMEIGKGATVPAPTATEVCTLLTTVSIVADVLTVTNPQMVYGNQNARRIGVSTVFSSDLWPMLPDAR